MAIYSVHVGARDDDPVFVKEGFSWPGFCFGPIWLAAKRLWIPLTFWVLLAGFIEIAVEVRYLPESIKLIVGLLVALILGFEGNDLRRGALARRGYSDRGLAAGENRDTAELRYFVTRPPRLVPARDVSPAPVAIAEPLGLFPSNPR